MSTKYKIKSTDIIREVKPTATASFLGRRVFVDTNLEISIEPLRGQGYASEVESFYVRVASVHRRGRVWSAFEQRVGGENWKAQLVGALAAAREAGERHKKAQDETFSQNLKAGKARLEYATQLGEKIGRTVGVSRVNTDQNGPTGITFTITLNGTVDEVAEKYSRVIVLATEYFNKTIL